VVVVVALVGAVVPDGVVAVVVAVVVCLV